MTLPLKEVAAALQEGVGWLMRDAGLELMQLVMDNEVRQLAGERYERRAPEQPYRWGREQGFLVVDGQKVPIERPRLRGRCLCREGEATNLGEAGASRTCPEARSERCRQRGHWRCQNALTRPDLKAGPPPERGSHVNAIRKPLRRSRGSAMLIVPGCPKWKSWLKPEKS